jgi:hypothetical protein
MHTAAESASGEPEWMAAFLLSLEREDFELGLQAFLGGRSSCRR